MEQARVAVKGEWVEEWVHDLNVLRLLDEGTDRLRDLVREIKESETLSLAGSPKEDQQRVDGGPLTETRNSFSEACAQRLLSRLRSEGGSSFDGRMSSASLDAKEFIAISNGCFRISILCCKIYYYGK